MEKKGWRGQQQPAAALAPSSPGRRRQMPGWAPPPLAGGGGACAGGGGGAGEGGGGGEEEEQGTRGTRVAAMVCTPPAGVHPITRPRPTSEPLARGERRMSPASRIRSHSSVGGSLRLFRLRLRSLSSSGVRSLRRSLRTSRCASHPSILLITS